MGVHRTCGEPNETELTPIGVRLYGSGRGPPGRLLGDELVEAYRDLPTQRSGKLFPVGIFLDFASSPTRTEGPRGAYVQVGGRNRTDSYWGEVLRLVARTPSSATWLPATRPSSATALNMLPTYLRQRLRVGYMCVAHGHPHTHAHTHTHTRSARQTSAAGADRVLA